MQDPPKGKEVLSWDKGELQELNVAYLIPDLQTVKSLMQSKTKQTTKKKQFIMPSFISQEPRD